MVAGYLGRTDLRGRLQWFGSALFFPASLLLMIGGLLVLPALEAPLRAGIASSGWVAPGYTGAAREAINEMTFTIARSFGSGLVVSAGVSFVGAALVVVLAMATPPTGQLDRKVVHIPVQNG